MRKIPDRRNSAQDAYLEWMKAAGVVVDIWTVQGSHYEGLVTDYDFTSILLSSRSGRYTRLVIKLQVSFIRPKSAPGIPMPRLIRAPRRKGHRPSVGLTLPVMRSRKTD